MLGSVREARGDSPARLWEVYLLGTVLDEAGSPSTAPESLGRVGIIASVTESFCGACTRTRLTTDGKIRSCLFSDTETDLMQLLRSGATDDELALRWREGMWFKPRAHGKEDADFDIEEFCQGEPLHERHRRLTPLAVPSIPFVFRAPSYSIRSMMQVHFFAAAGRGGGYRRAVGGPERH